MSQPALSVDRKVESTLHECRKPKANQKDTTCPLWFATGIVTRQ